MRAALSQRQSALQRGIYSSSNPQARQCRMAPARSAPADAVATAAPAPPAAAPAKPSDVVTIYFRQEGTSTQARPGEDLIEAASRCKADIPTGCLHGSCGVCEVELHRYKDAQGGPVDGGPVVVRACIAKVPRGWGRVEVGMMADDQVWGQDGWDT